MAPKTSARTTAVRDPYAVLGVDRQADEAEIKKAYFRLVRQYSPEHAPERFQEIRAAYEQVRDPEARAQTNLFLVQPPPALPNRRLPKFDLDVHSEDIITLAVELGLADIKVQKDYHEPNLPR